MNNRKLIAPQDYQGWLTLGIEQVGRSHLKERTPCQDAVCIEYIDGGIVAAISDGVGFLENSHAASRAAVEGVAEWFRANSEKLRKNLLYPENIQKDLIRFLSIRLDQEAKAQMIDLQTMDCNLAFVLLPSPEFAICGCLGDCAVCLIGAQSRVLSTYSDFANGTDSILGEDSHKRMKVEVLRINENQIQGFMLTTDGLENEIYLKNSEVLRKRAEDYFNVAVEPEPVQALSDYLSELSEYFIDDISIAILSRAHARITLPPDPTWLCSCGCRNPITVTYCTECYMDFVELYKGANINRDRARFFRELNKLPSEEHALLQKLKARDTDSPVEEPTTAQTTAVRQRTARPRINTPSSMSRSARTEQPLSANAGIGADLLAQELSYGLTENIPDQKPSHDFEDNASVHRLKVRGKKAGRPQPQTHETQSGSAEQNRMISILLKWLAGLTVVVLLLISMLVMLLLQTQHIQQQLDALENTSQSYEDDRQTVPDEEMLEVYLVGKRLVFLRAEPNDDSQSICSVNQEDRLEVQMSSMTTDDAGDTWVQVHTEHGDIGWCRFSVLKSADEADQNN